MNVKQAYELTKENQLKITLGRLNKAMAEGKTSLIIYEHDFAISPKFIGGLREDGFKCEYVKGDREGGEENHLLIDWSNTQVKAYEVKIAKAEPQDKFFIGVDWASGEDVQTYCLYKISNGITEIIELDSIAKNRTLFRNTICWLASEYNAELININEPGVQPGSGTSTHDILNKITREKGSTITFLEDSEKAKGVDDLREGYIIESFNGAQESEIYCTTGWSSRSVHNVRIFDTYEEARAMLKRTFSVYMSIRKIYY